jgi:hypothetical protein
LISITVVYSVRTVPSNPTLEAFCGEVDTLLADLPHEFASPGASVRRLD